MAHMMKIKSGSVGALVDHYERNREGTLIRENIDQDRTHLNYNLRQTNVQEWVRMAMIQHEQEAGRAVRSDANVLFDWVVTLPEDCPAEDARAFFTACLDFLGERYGASNVLGGYVHMDETTPHMHAPILPMIGGKLQASKMVTRADLRTFHGDLGKFVDERLGFHVSIELDDDKVLDRMLSRSAENMREFQAAKDAAKSQIAAEVSQEQRRLECLQRATEEAERDVDRLEGEIAAIEAQPAAPSVGKDLGTIASGRGLGEREREAAEEGEHLGSRVAELERGVAEARSICEGLRGRIEVARSRIEEIAGNLGRSITVRIAEGRHRVLDILARHGVAYTATIGSERTRDTLEDAMRRAREASQALNRDRGHQRRPGRGMER